MVDDVDKKDSQTKRTIPNIHISSAFKKQLTPHVLIIGCIALLLLIPQLFVDLLLSERQNISHDIKQSITKSWAKEEVLYAPYLSVNYKINDKQSYNEQTLYIYSNETKTNVKFKTEERTKGNYTAILYLADITMHSKFDLKNLHNLKINNESIDYYLADSFNFAITHDNNKYIDNIKYLKINGKEYDVKGYGYDSFIADIRELAHDVDSLDVELSFTVKGSGSFSYIPNSKKSYLSLEGDLIPEFTGSFLPSEHKISKDGFIAKYENHQLATGILDTAYDLKSNKYKNNIKLNFQDNNNDYKLIDRLTKYSILFIAITFTLILCFEIIKNIILSPLQFIVIGIALVVFYLVLISLSEYISVSLSYFIAALIMTSMISLYVKAIFNDKKIFIGIIIALIFLYIILFTIVHAERYALLFGTLLVLIMLAFIMLTTKNLSEKFNND